MGIDTHNETENDSYGEEEDHDSDHGQNNDNEVANSKGKYNRHSKDEETNESAYDTDPTKNANSEIKAEFESEHNGPNNEEKDNHEDENASSHDEDTSNHDNT